MFVHLQKALNTKSSEQLNQSWKTDFQQGFFLCHGLFWPSPFTQLKSRWHIEQRGSTGAASGSSPQTYCRGVSWHFIWLRKEVDIHTTECFYILYRSGCCTINLHIAQLAIQTKQAAASKCMMFRDLLVHWDRSSSRTRDLLCANDTGWEREREKWMFNEQRQTERDGGRASVSDTGSNPFGTAPWLRPLQPRCGQTSCWWFQSMCLFLGQNTLRCPGTCSHHTHLQTDRQTDRKLHQWLFASIIITRSAKPINISSPSTPTNDCFGIVVPGQE